MLFMIVATKYLLRRSLVLCVIRRRGLQRVLTARVPTAGEHIMTIPGTSKLENLKTNLGGYDVVLAEDDLQSLDRLADRVMGDRYDQRGMSIING